MRRSFKCLMIWKLWKEFINKLELKEISPWQYTLWILNYKDKVWVKDEIQLPEKGKLFDPGTLSTIRTGEVFLIVPWEFNSWRMILYDLRTKGLRTNEITSHPQIQLYSNNNPKGFCVHNVYYHVENILPLRCLCEGR
jgi:hypothetical protein